MKKISLVIPRAVWNRRVGKLLEDLTHNGLLTRGVLNLVRVRVSKGDIDIVVFDKLRNIIYIIEVKNLSGAYRLEKDKIEELIGKFRRIEEWIECKYGHYKINRILVISKLGCERVLRRQLRKVHKIHVVEAGLQAIPEEFRGKLHWFTEKEIEWGVGRAFSEDWIEWVSSKVLSKLCEIIAPNEWDKARMLNGLSEEMTFEEAIKSLKPVDFAHLHAIRIPSDAFENPPYFSFYLFDSLHLVGKPPPLGPKVAPRTSTSSRGLAEGIPGGHLG